MKKKCNNVYNILYKEYGKVACPLHYEFNFQLMVAVMLSAQCTDIAVNKVTPQLFAVFPDSIAMSKALLENVEKIIRPLGLYHGKAKNIIASSKFLIENCNNLIPEEIEEMVKFPGIGRKTANVIVSHAFNKPGFAVDTHVKRLLNRIGIVKSDYPDKIEFIIRDYLVPKNLGNFSLLLITHGRKCCKARKPDCSGCIIKPICNYGSTIAQ
jgi:endonuclease III